MNAFWVFDFVCEAEVVVPWVSLFYFFYFGQELPDLVAETGRNPFADSGFQDFVFGCNESCPVFDHVRPFLDTRV